MTVLILIFVISVLFVIHPFVTYPLSLRVIRRFVRPPTAVCEEPRSFAVACCMLNERSVVESKIRNMLEIAQQLQPCQLLVHSDGSTDGTSEILQAHRDRFSVSISPTRQGKSVGMNALLAMTDADIVIFTDANVTIDPRGVASLKKAFTDPTVGCVLGYLQYVNADESTTAMTGSLYWRLEEQVKHLESDTGCVMGADGSIFAIRRKLFREVPKDIIDDFFTSMSIVCSGSRIVCNRELVAYERSEAARQDETRRKVRIACRAFNCHRLLWPQIRRLPALRLYQYLSHKFVRWLSGFFIISATLAFLGMLLVGLGPMALLAGLGALGLLVLGMVRVRTGPLGALGDVLTAFMATALGVVRSLQGQRFQTWNVAARHGGDSPAS
jgi:cellulose synthase/poly-beta-1,6-N-acetylglucosamine synthase-like glycosyltransferase